MNHLRKRLEGFADEVKQAGLAGESMQAKLASVIDREDLSENEIQRVAELANRGAQMDLFKVAEDKRFKFDLADHRSATKHARKIAESSLHVQASKVAAIEEANGDPFAPLDTAGPVKLSLYEHPVDETIVHELEAAETRDMILKLGQIREELLITKTAGKQQGVAIYGKASDAKDAAVQSAADMIAGGLKLPDLYMALRAAVSGSEYNTTANVREVDALCSLILTGLKERGIPNHRLGFAFKGDLGEIDGMSSDDILALCKRAAGLPEKGPDAGDITMQTQKRAQRYLLTVPDPKKTSSDKHPFEDAEDWMVNRKAQKDYPTPSQTLDAKVVDNQPNGKTRIVNGDSEFIIAIKDLVGCQRRLGRSHAAQEYLGLKIKQIEQSINKLDGAQKTADAEFEQSKEAFGALLAGAGRALAGGAGKLLGTAKTMGKGLSLDNKVNLGTTAAMGAMTAAPFLMKSKDMKAQEALSKGQGA